MHNTTVYHATQMNLTSTWSGIIIIIMEGFEKVDQIIKNLTGLTVEE